MLRRRYLPKIGAFWREIGAEGARELEMVEVGAPRHIEKLSLPSDEESRKLWKEASCINTMPRILPQPA